jgi:peroxiredoxin
LQQIEQDLINLGYQLFAVSPDVVDQLQATVDKNELKYRLLSDRGMKASQAFGIAFRDEEMVRRYRESYRLDLEAYAGDDHHMLPVPAVFVLDTDGRIAFHYVNPDYEVRLPETVLLEAAKAALK